MDNEKLQTAFEQTKTALNDLIVAIRGGGDLRPAADAAQALLDSLKEDAPAEGEPDGEGDAEGEDKEQAGE